MRTFDLSMTNAPLPYGPHVEIIARHKDSNDPAVVMDWAGAHLWIAADAYEEDQLEALVHKIEDAIRSGAPRFPREGRLNLLRRDLGFG
jgi:hypothetical protein